MADMVIVECSISAYASATVYMTSLYLNRLESAKDLLADEPLLRLEGLELANISWLDTDVPLLSGQ
jgi:hypothetical protein